MINNKTILAIIPARKNSKRLPNKNCKIFHGKPLILWTIEYAKKSRFIDNIIVTTDDPKIINIAKNENIEYLIRPEELATDRAKTTDVVLDLLFKIPSLPDYIILLQPTSPLRDNIHIDGAIEYLNNKNADAVISVCENEHNPLWSNILPEDLSLINFLNPDIKNKRSQDLPKYYRLNGAIYICKTSSFIEVKTFFLSSNIYAFVMDKYSSVDIDDQFDFYFAEFIYDKIKNGKEF